MFSKKDRFAHTGWIAGMAVLPLLILAVGGCGGADDGAPDTAEPAPPVEDTSVAPRAFFAEPADGATVQAPVHLVFGAEGFTIEPAGDETVHQGAGHMHIGIDTECLPADTVIPKASPWIHFGDGSMEIDVDLTPGEHTIALQIGDGEHRTLDEPGLCNVITLNVE